VPRPERGATDRGFRQQLLERLKNEARRQGTETQRVQQRVAFERLLARLAASGEWLLKGGFALELRYGWRNRPTRDIDLRTEREPEQALARLREAVAGPAPADDRFRFELGDAVAELQGAPGGGLRVRVVARVAGVTFASFAVDLTSGDAVVAAPETLVGSDLLAFAGIAPVRFPVYPVTQHLAEKLHAYTLPRAQENTRTKDLLDMVTIAAMETIEGEALAEAAAATFAARGSHHLPATLPAPPAAWTASFRQLAAETAISPTADLRAGYELAARFWAPVLTGTALGRRWGPGAQAWDGPGRDVGA
jgi:predicted nucleotidyltransferase component of viral defense system